MIRPHPSFPLTSALLIALLSLAGPSAADNAPLEHHTVVLTGDPVPGEGEGSFFQWICAPPSTGPDAPVIDEEGNPGFVAGWGNSVFEPHGLFREVDGVLELIVKRGDPAPGVGVPFELFPGLFPLSPSMSGGRSSFVGQVTLESIQRSGIWTDRSGSLELAVFQTDHPPGAPPGYFFSSWFQTLRGDRIVLIGTWGGGLNDVGFWREAGAGLEAIVVAGDEAPGTGGKLFGNDSPYAFPAFLAWDLDDASRIVFHAMIRGTSDLQDEGVWAEGEAGLELIALEGEPAPGDPGAVYLGNAGFRTFGHDHCIDIFRSGTGHVLFGAMTDVPGNSYPGAGLYTNRSGSVERVALSRPAAESPPGDQAPGYPPGVSLAEFINGSITDSGLIAYNAFTSSASIGIWWDRNGGFERIVATGDGVQGLPGSWTLEIPIQLRFRDPGYLLFSSSILTGGPNQMGVFLVDPDGDVHLVAATSLAYEVRPGDFRIVGNIVRSSQLGDQGQTVCVLEFTDGSEALIVARPAAPTGTGPPGFPDGGPVLSAHPNPFGRETSISAVLPAPANVDIEVYDVAGRRIRTLLHGSRQAGNLLVRWDGRDEMMRRAASGIYFARLRIDGRTQSLSKLLLVR